MAKKKSFTQSDLIDFYMNYVLEHHEKPKSVYAFAKKNGMEEATFYTFFSSFEVLEATVFYDLCETSIDTLSKSEEFQTFDARNKLLSFYFTFFENMTANRSFIQYLLKDGKQHLKSYQKLSKLKASYTAFYESLAIETLGMKQESLEKIKNRTMKESVWFQLVMTIKFWMDDTSPSFEKTDIFIEKSVNTSFDLMDLKPFRSLIDLGKFLIKEKVSLN